MERQARITWRLILIGVVIVVGALASALWPATSGLVVCALIGSVLAANAA
jgi:NhaP-type Na+/H+ or K+/H+ antiporter